MREEIKTQVADDPVRDYLERQGYAGYIVEGGVEYLLVAWEDMVEAVVHGEAIDDNQYRLGVDRRRILEETLDLIPLYEQAWYHRRVHEADQQIRRHLVYTGVPLCGPAVAAERGYTPDHDWWYFYRPRRTDEMWHK